MLIITENTTNSLITVKTPMDVVKAFEYIEECLSNIDSALMSLHRIFIRSDWNLREGYSDSLRVYSIAVKKVRENLTNLEEVIVTLANFILSDKRPIPLSKDAPKEINRFIKNIETTVKHYYYKTKNKSFPTLDDEVKRCKTCIQKINFLIAKINGINNSVGQLYSVGKVADLII